MEDALYHSTTIEEGFNGSLNPGGVELSTHLLGLMNLKSCQKIIDLGCGKGQSLDILKSRQLPCIGLEPDKNFAQICKKNGHQIIRGTMENLPFREGSISALICQCSFNLSDKARSLSEFYRVLRPGGVIGITDIFLHAPKERHWPMKTCLNGAMDCASIAPLFEDAGFKISHFEDHSPRLKQKMAEMIFKHGSLRDFWQAITGCPIKAEQACLLGKKTRPGLFLLIAKKPQHHNHKSCYSEKSI